MEAAMTTRAEGVQSSSQIVTANKPTSTGPDALSVAQPFRDL